MKKFAWRMGTILLVLMLIAVGCSTTPAPATPAASTPATQPKVTVEQGTISTVNPTNDTVTIETPEGPQTVSINQNTAITLNGNTCTIDQLGQLTDSGQDFNCTVVSDENGNVLSVDVTSIPRPASVKGTISDVNIKDSTITVQTGSGPRVFDVDPNTGELIGGVACSLELINALLDAGANLPCTVVYSVADNGTAQYIDITNPPNITQGTGTVTSVDIQKSSVTIQTDKGPRTFTVNAKTGEFLNGEVCSLEDVSAAAAEGASFGACQVVYYTDANGNLLYVDISQAPTTP